MTTRRLVLVRHAKAVGAAGDASITDDSARPLAARGESDAAEAGRRLAEHGVRPDRVVVSPSRRTRQTWDLAARHLGEATTSSAPLSIDDRMYDNTAQDLLHIVQETSPEVGTLVLVGHYPSVRDLALLLDDGGGTTVGASALAERYPTAGIAVLALHTEWGRVAARTATLEAFLVPRGD